MTSVRKLLTKRISRPARKIRRYARYTRYYFRYGYRDAFADQRKLLSQHKVETIFDIGANQGDTVEAYLRLFPEAQIYAFEPTLPVYNTLNTRFKSASQVKPIQFAVGDSEREVTFFVNDSRSDMNSVYRPSSRNWVQDVYSITVNMTSLDSFCSVNNIPEIDLLKIDIQGGEVAALQGASGLLSNGKIGCIYLECQILPLYEGQPLLGDIFTELYKHDYTLFNFYNFHESVLGQVRWCDGIFISPKLQAIIEDVSAAK